MGAEAAGKHNSRQLGNRLHYGRAHATGSTPLFEPTLVAAATRPGFHMSQSAASGEVVVAVATLSAKGDTARQLTPRVVVGL